MTYRAVQQELRLEPKTIQKERFSIDNRMHHICEVLIEQKKTSYFSLIEKDFNKIDAINTFLATLELMKNNKFPRIRKKNSKISKSPSRKASKRRL